MSKRISTDTFPASGDPNVPPGMRKVTKEFNRKNRVERWFYHPLEEFKKDGDKSFATLTLLFPLIEKYLRWKCSMKEDERFSEGHRAFNHLGSLLGASNVQCYHAWQMFRNGLLHRAAIKSGDAGNLIETAALYRDSKSLEQVGSHLKINPYTIRDVMLERFRDSWEMWRDEDYRLMEEYTLEEE